jgi:hypothetical protein
MYGCGDGKAITGHYGSIRRWRAAVLRSLREASGWPHQAMASSDLQQQKIE